MIGFYDNLHLMLWGIHEVVPHLENVVKKFSASGELIGIHGGHKGLRVGVFSSGTSIIGSLAKFLNGGSNIEPLDTRSMLEALEKLSDGLHVDVSVAKVTSLEFGTQFPMTEAVGAYLCRLGNLTKYNRSTLSEGNLESLYYEQSAKKLKFYDKGQEARFKGISLPDQWCHLLKYELTLTKRLNRFLGFTPIATDLCDRENYRRLAMLWRDLYHKIEKQKIPIMNEEGQKLTSNTFFKLLSSFAIGQLDKDFVLGFIENAKAMGMERKELYRLKQLIKKATDDSVPDELMRELDDCIDNAVAYL